MSRCPNCDTPLHITRAASPVIESDGAHEYRMNAINSAPPKSSEPEKVPTPASDSAKGERDRHGRTIIARNDFAMVVECCTDVDDKERFQISSACTGFWFGEDGDGWLPQSTTDRYWGTGIHTKEWCMTNLAVAASTPLPTANPAASAKGQDTRFASDFLELDRAIAELNRRITKLEARQ